jgi:RNA polymerase sigma factor (TIGR02999 family)
MAEPPDLTLFLDRWRKGDDEAAAELLGAVYDDLQRLAGGYMRRERASHTLQATALLHEAWLRLSRSNAPMLENREQFFRAMAAHMRRHLVDHARRRGAEKRGGGAAASNVEDVAEFVAAAPFGDEEVEPQLEQLDRALEKLEAVYPRAAQVIQLRMFGGKSVEETAAALSLSAGTVKRDFHAC